MPLCVDTAILLVMKGPQIRVRPEDYDTLDRLREEHSLRTFGDVVSWLLDDEDDDGDSFLEDEI